MKYISQTIDFISYTNGEAVEPTTETFEYCFGPIPNEGEKVKQPESDAGWSTDMSNPWDDDGNRLYYVWRRTKVDWTNGETTYVGYLLLDDYEIATVLANQEGYASVGAWCREMNKTIIDGATIMTGTIDADKIKVNELSAISANMGTVTAGVIQSLDYKKQGTAAVWDSISGNLTSDGLEYTLNDDGTRYNVSVGVCTDTDIVIPGIYNGLPVVVGYEGFSWCENITSVTLCRGVEAILPYAFCDCSNLTSIIIPNSVTTIGEYAFSYCSRLTTVTFEEGILLNSIASSTFEECCNLADFIIPNSVISIGDRAFNSCYKITSINFPMGLTAIGESAFEGAGLDGEIVIPVGVATIGAYAFADCETNGGAPILCCEAESIPEGWDTNWNSNSYPVYYYSETTPNTEGNYWHYNETNGFKISCNDEYFIDSKHFKVTPDGDVTANSGKIAGWDITENGINKEGVVGMSSGGTSYDSLVNEGNASPIRFYAGGQIDFDMANPIRTETLTFPTDDGKWSRTISLTEEEQRAITIKEAECLKATNVFSITETYVTTINTHTSQAGQYYPIVSGQNVTLPFSYDPIDDEVTVSCTNSRFLKVEYKGGGVAYLSGGTETSGSQSATIYYSYQYEETPNVGVEINDDATAVTYTLTPQREDVDYTIDVQYAVSAKKQNFMVLEDGSLYANAAKISGDSVFEGTIKAEGGNIAQLQISGGGLTYQVDGADVYSLNNAGLILNKSSATIQVGDLTLGYNDTEKATLIKTSGHLILRGDNNTQLEFMKEKSSTTAESDAILYYQYIAEGSNGTNARVWVEVAQAPLYPITFNVKWQSRAIMGISGSGTVSIPLDSNSTKSSAVNFSYSGIGVQFQKNDGSWSDMVNSSTSTNVGVVGHFNQISSPENLYVTGNLLPSGSTYNLGGSELSQFWNNIYCNTSAIDLSDRNKKNTIQSLSDSYTQIFDALKPVSYKFNVSNNNRTHTGLIAQDVKEAIENVGLTTQDFAGYCEWENDDGTIGCGLRYGEFISLCIDQIQKLKKRVEELENKLNTIQND